jgi:hypothetical protein
LKTWSYPEEIEPLEKATADEKKVFRFLKDAARPDKDFIALRMMENLQVGRRRSSQKARAAKAVAMVIIRAVV